MSIKKYCSLFILISLSINAFGQMGSQIVGKWKGVFRFNQDTIYTENLGDSNEIYYTFFINNAFRSHDVRRKGKTKDTFQMGGRWEMVGKDSVAVVNRSRIPKLPNEGYGEKRYKILRLTKKELYLFGKYSMDGAEGSYGTIVFSRVE